MIEFIKQCFLEVKTTLFCLASFLFALVFALVGTLKHFCIMLSNIISFDITMYIKISTSSYSSFHTNMIIYQSLFLKYLPITDTPFSSYNIKLLVETLNTSSARNNFFQIQLNSQSLFINSSYINRTLFISMHYF